MPNVEAQEVFPLWAGLLLVGLVVVCIWLEGRRDA